MPRGQNTHSVTQRILDHILAMLRKMTSNSKDDSTKAPSDLFKSWTQRCSCDNHRDEKELGVNVEKKLKIKFFHLEHKTPLKNTER